MFDFGLSELIQHQKDYAKRWRDCRRWYKWLSLLQLTLSGLCTGLCVTLTGLGAAMVATGSCFGAVGASMGTTTTYYTDGTRDHTDHGACCKAVSISLQLSGGAIFLAGIIIYVLAWLLLGLTFICLYEELNFKVPLEKFAIKSDAKIPKLNIYSSMDTKSTVIGEILLGVPFEGHMVYTGWVLIFINGGIGWIYCSKFGKLVVTREVVKQDPVSIDQVDQVKAQIKLEEEIRENRNGQVAPAPPIPVQQVPPPIMPQQHIAVNADFPPDFPPV